MNEEFGYPDLIKMNEDLQSMRMALEVERSEYSAMRAKAVRLRSSLVGLVGTDDERELIRLRETINQDRVILDAVQALLRITTQLD